jgi:lysophospholipase L1-like esterase
LIFLCFGNSLTAGYPGYNPHIDGITNGYGNLQSQYEYWLKKHCLELIEEKRKTQNIKFEEELVFVNKGVPGDTSSGLLHRADRDLLSFKPKPDYSIIIIGTNDLGWSLSTEKIFNNIKKIHQISRENGILSIGGLIPPITRRAADPRWDIMRSDFNEDLRTFFNENNIKFTEYTYMVDEEGYLKQENTSGDGVHFSVAGYKQMGYSIFENVIKSLLDDRISSIK